MSGTLGDAPKQGRNARSWWDRWVRLCRYKLVIPMKRSPHSPEHGARGVMIGLMWGLTPTVGIQMVFCLLTWVIAKRFFKWDFSLIISLAWTWTTNVITLVPAYYLFFLTGQVMLGWCSLYRVTQEDRFLTAAVDAANWLLTVQDADGKWRRHSFMDAPHAYHTRVAWALLETYQLAGEDRYRHAAESNIKWALSFSGRHGWLEYMGFTPDEAPLTHTIAYTLRGLLESARFLPDVTATEAKDLVLAAAHKTLRVYELRKRVPEDEPAFFPGAFAQDWRPARSPSCLVGNAQMAIIWLKVYQLTQDARFLNGALKMLDQVKQTQDLSSGNAGIHGGVAGSYPVWGPYLRLAYPNWAAKFFADALMLQEALMEPLEISRAPGVGT